MKFAKRALSVLLALLMLATVLPVSVYAATLKITTQPKTSYTEYGGTATATVKATGDGLTYTWYIKNAGKTSYSKSSVTKATYSAKMDEKSSGRYVYCVVKDKKGKTVKSNTIVLRMKATITTEPKTTYAKKGETAKATVAAKGDGLKYTWYIKNAGKTKYAKSSVTKATYSTTMSDTVHGRYAYCVVTDKYGKTAKSKTIVLRQQATITTQPKSVKVDNGATAKITVKATGDGLTYQWYIKNADKTKYSKSSVTKATYSVTMSDAVDGRYAYCIVTDKYGKTDKSKTVSLRQKEAPLTITMQPENVTAAVGDEVGFGIVVKGGVKPYTYQWQYTDNKMGEWANVPDKAVIVTGDMVSTVLTASEVAFRNKFRVRCIVTDAAGNKVISNVAYIERRVADLTITMQPENTTAAVGNEVGFGVVAEGGVAPYTYRWVYVCDGVTQWTDAEGEILTLGNQNMLSFSVEQKHFDKQYLFCCFVTDAEGNEVTTEVVWIEEKEEVAPLTIDWQTPDLAISEGDRMEFAVGVSGGTEPYTYRWQYLCDGMDMWQDCDVESDTLALTIQSTHFDNHYQYRCVITDAEGDEVISDPMRPVELLDPFLIVTQPQNETAQAFDRVSFSVVVEGGKAPYTYEWQYRRDGLDWTPFVGDWADGMGTATISFGIDDSEFTYHYQYRCVITDANGNVVYSDTAWVEQG
ncbi:MAG: immunoglobulin domain-containing protein [Ruminococcaceae bacterium]|nr:immunoglobulin domain-containing protein [Oscillospiraceae bacterium]